MSIASPAVPARNSDYTKYCFCIDFPDGKPSLAWPYTVTCIMRAKNLKHGWRRRNRAISLKNFERHSECQSVQIVTRYLRHGWLHNSDMDRRPVIRILRYPVSMRPFQMAHHLVIMLVAGVSRRSMKKENLCTAMCSERIYWIQT